MSKPSWDTAPEWANWLAMDGNGEWYWYESKPEWRFNIWRSEDASCGAGYTTTAIDSLEQRP